LRITVDALGLMHQGAQMKIVLLLVVVLAGCGGGDPDPEPDSTTQPVKCEARSCV
jgi:hypothetical protein